MAHLTSSAQLGCFVDYVLVLCCVATLACLFWENILTQTFRAVCVLVCSISVYVHARKQYICVCMIQQCAMH